MNLYKYSEYPFSHWLTGVVHFWSSAWYRPMGGILYLLLFNAFGFHALPLPFKLVLFAIFLFNMVLFLHFVKNMTGTANNLPLAGFGGESSRSVRRASGSWIKMEDRRRKDLPGVLIPHLE